MLPLQPQLANYAKKIGKTFDQPEAAPEGAFAAPRFSVFLCFTNRCGSNLLADSLTNAGVLPGMGEPFNIENVAAVAQRRKLRSFRDFCRVQVRQRNKNRIFASKIAWFQLLYLCRNGLIPNEFGPPKFIWMRRRDILAQAISFSIATQTNAWTSKLAPVAAPKYDEEDIEGRIAWICTANAEFKRFFSTFGIEPYRVIYEDFVPRIGETTIDIVNWLGLGPIEPPPLPSRLSRQASDINDEWRARFLASHRIGAETLGVGTDDFGGRDSVVLDRT